MLDTQHIHVMQCGISARESWQGEVMIYLVIKRCVEDIPLLNNNLFTGNCKCCVIKAVAFVLRILCVWTCEDY